jgi:hypothetical protein
MNGSNISNTPSPTVSPTEFFSTPSKSSSLNDTPQTPEPPPIPPRSSLLNTTNQHRDDQTNHSNETSIKAGRDNVRSRNFRRRESTNTRSDSADAFSVSSSKHHHRQVSSEQEVNSD